MATRGQSIVVGLDFGTTHSGMAWAVKDGASSSSISGWPSSRGDKSDKEKVPSALVYQSGEREPLWGYTVPWEEAPIKWFKLLLLDKKDLPESFRDSKNLQTAKSKIRLENRHVNEVIADYLKALWKHGVQNIEKCLGRNIVSRSKFELVVTLPAIWPLYARQRMREAVQMAGILDVRTAGETGLSFITEPEAAALATVEDFASTVGFKKNDHFVVCDAGGGTVDLISYKIIREKPIQLRESAKGDGKLCGAVVLDERFLALLKSKVPKGTWDKLGKPGREHLMDFQWEAGLKTQIHQDMHDARVPMPFGATSELGVTHLSFTKIELMNVYKPVVAEVVELVFKQVREVMKGGNKAPKFIVMAGGFGKSRVLRDALEESIEGQGFSTSVLQAPGNKPWTAIFRGAVLRGFSNCNPTSILMVDARVARASYGTTMNVLPWDAIEHDSRDQVWCPIQQEFLAVDQTQWFIEAGETLSTNEPVSHNFWQDFDEPQVVVQQRRQAGERVLGWVSGERRGRE